jgi:Ca2+-binding EF-hand superfamily protein
LLHHVQVSLTIHNKANHKQFSIDINIKYILRKIKEINKMASLTLKDAFNDYDDGEKGYMSKSDLITFIGEYDDSIKPFTIEILFDHMDPSGDSKISLDEFKEAFGNA